MPKGEVKERGGWRRHEVECHPPDEISRIVDGGEVGGAVL